MRASTTINIMLSYHVSVEKNPDKYIIELVSKDIKKIKAIDLQSASPVKKTVYATRTFFRDLLGGRDVVEANNKPKKAIKKIYKKADDFILRFFPASKKPISKKMALKRISDAITEMGYSVVEYDEAKPWGAYYRFSDRQAERFIKEFFPGLKLSEAKLGRDDTEISPKILVVSPQQRLSWQYHYRRAERWRFLSDGAYHKSKDDKPGKIVKAKADDIVQFDKLERHRLVGKPDGFTIVAEIWQHTDADNLSNEDDIVRIQDDYAR